MPLEDKGSSVVGLPQIVVVVVVLVLLLGAIYIAKKRHKVSPCTVFMHMAASCSDTMCNIAMQVVHSYHHCFDLSIYIVCKYHKWNTSMNIHLT